MRSVRLAACAKVSRPGGLRAAGLRICRVLLIGVLLPAHVIATPQEDVGGDGLSTVNNPTLMPENKPDGREQLHPGAPLLIRGIGQEGNDFRSRTPALANGDLSPTLLREDDNYARRIAMYAAGARFSTAPNATTRKYSRPAADTQTVKKPAAVRSLASWIWLPAVALLMLLLVVGLCHRDVLAEVFSGKRQKTRAGN